MDLFWKRGKKDDGSFESLSGSDSLPNDTRLLSFLSDRTAAEDGASHAHGDTAKSPAQSHLVFADEAEIHALAELPEQIDVEALVARLTDRSSRPKRGMMFWMWVIAAPIFVLWLIASLLNGEFHWAPLCLFGLATARTLVVQSARQAEDRAALHNAHLDGRWLGPLCEALEWPDKHVRGTAARLLTQFLPRVREGDARMFRDEHRTCLYRRLTASGVRSDPDLALAILRALSFIGSEAALPYVERLANRPALTRNGRRLRSMARATLAGLERRAAMDRTLAATAGGDVESREDFRDLKALVEGDAPLSEAEREELAALNAHVDRQMAEFEEAMRKLRVPGMRMGYLVASWCIIFPYFAVQTVLQCHDGNWLGAILCAVLTLLSTQLYRWTLTAEHTRLARKLSKVDDVRCIGRLAEALDWPDTGVRNVTIDALTRLLKRVKASDSVLTTPRQRANVHRMLVMQNAKHHAEFLESILQALGQIGAADSVAFVQHLADTAPVSPRQARVSDAARDCLDYLKVRAELNRSSQTLLRASSASATTPDTLVRPAEARAVTDPAQLLRADSGSPTA